MQQALAPQSAALTLTVAANAHIALFAADPAFASGIPAADRPLAARVLKVPRLDLDVGAWTPPAPDRFGPAPLALVADGLLGRHVTLGARVATHILGPGDVFSPWPASGDAFLPPAVRWSAYGPATIAVLDGRFGAVAQRWPALSRTVQTRLATHADRLAFGLAICQLPRVGDRILALLWHLAERFGRMAPDGVVVGVRLTHRLIGELVGAQRPTVSLALASLLEEGPVSRRPDGMLVLGGAPSGALTADAVPARLAA
jgi:CRP/FNR family transcriptional regulator, cyclic AMP receptor protein